MFGGFDYIVALRGRASWESFFHPRVQLATIAAEAGVGCLDVPWLDIKDEAGLVAETDRVRSAVLWGPPADPDDADPTAAR